jgi:hypothetical protein
VINWLIRATKKTRRGSVPETCRLGRRVNRFGEIFAYWAIVNFGQIFLEIIFLASF